MMDNTNPFAPATLPVPSETPAPDQNVGISPEAAEGASPGTAPAPAPAVAKFNSCRWRATPDVGEYCTHRDVLPFAGKEGFVAESWCPECAFYKLRRTPKKRDYSY